MRLTQRQRLVYLYLAQTRRWLARVLQQPRALSVSLPGTGTGRLIVAPTDLRAIDPFVAEEIYEGRFPLAGRVLDAGNQSPFLLELPSYHFAVRLHSFSWLRHIRADKSAGACANARAILDDWIDLHGSRVDGVAWEADVLAQRVIAWLSHSTVVLQDADSAFYRRFLASLSFQVRYMRRLVGHAPAGLPRLRLRIALAMASISMETRVTRLRRAARELDRELERQILPDGGHVSRNPQAAVDLLFDLLPLRQTYINLGHDVPAKLIPAIDRMYPAIRFFRHQSGDLALFNGASSTLANDLMSVLRYDETAGKPFKALPHSQYHRMAAGSTVLLIDTGLPLSSELTRTAHAGCLSFELSSGRHRFIVNSGSPRFAGEKLRQLARTTAAHSTVCVGTASSARFSESDFLGPVMISGVSKVDVSRQTGPDASDRLCANHDGYLGKFGVLHEREIRINEAGNKIAGRDRFLHADGTPETEALSEPAIARFHIHPAIMLERIDERRIRLMATDGESWTFSVPAGTLEIGEDVFFADASGIRPSQQLEVAFHGPEIRWFLAHHA
ncbi:MULTISPECIES: heparinase II/III family protein [Alphaproteobacteria]|uniref:Heparinase n=2 Tax=Alphaproteobacteria TaxID=28211 RepID=A0A512HME0_9HYPH|nr:MULTISPECIES: heparinase II/III family protein [Alphaproteobacteria]GEO86615.1 heparinase [Ciceribacter naphthalenivorans]GLR20813.1 heparinase [Ciceribacter naphthalenivorans]GLT03669.1 heparinase [Sphingomonas psychrolutea]